jgi:hypothetical protein
LLALLNAAAVPMGDLGSTPPSGNRYMKHTARVWCTLTVTYDNGDRLYGLVVRVPGYRSKGPGSIPCTTRFSEK